MSSDAHTINDFIIGKSFEQDMFNPGDPMRAQGAPMFEKDVVDGDFERIYEKGSRRKKLVIALCVLGFVGASFFAAVKFAPSLLGLAPAPVVAFPMAAAGGVPSQGIPAQASQELPEAVSPVMPATASVVAVEDVPATTASTSFEPPATDSLATPSAEARSSNSEPAKPVAVKIEPSKAPTSTKPVSQTKPITLASKPAPVDAKKANPPPAENSSAEGQGAAVKPVVSLSASQIGLRSFSTDSVAVSPTGGEVKSYRVGDSLPNGEKLLKLDASSMTIVTDRRVIRVQ